jgi:hypothetical protein
MKKAYCVLTEEYFVGYVFSETTGKAKSFALNSRLETDGCEFTEPISFNIFTSSSSVGSTVFLDNLGNTESSALQR